MDKMEKWHDVAAQQTRREFLVSAGIVAFSLGSPLPDFSSFFEKKEMGIVVHSYWKRWNSKVPSERFPAFQNAIQLMEHSHAIGAGGIQVGVNGWTEKFVRELATLREKTKMFLEGSIRLPGSESDLERFGQEIKLAKIAGVEVFRTVCLNGRRYEDFKSQSEFDAFKEKSIASLKLAAPIVSNLGVRLAVENHKDWRADELLAILKMIGNEHVGVTLDFGNNTALMEDPNEVIEALAPFAFSTHVKDMGVKEYENGMLLSEVPLGQGMIDLKKAVELCRKYNSDIHFSLEMITRDPLEIPFLDQSFWATFGELRSSVKSDMIDLIQSNEFSGDLPRVSQLDDEQLLALEEKNILECLKFSKETLKLGQYSEFKI